MNECDLYDAVLKDVLLERCDLREATLTGMKAERVELRACALAGARGADALRGARMPWNDVINNASLFATALGMRDRPTEPHPSRRSTSNSLPRRAE